MEIGSAPSEVAFVYFFSCVMRYLDRVSEGQDGTSFRVTTYFTFLYFLFYRGNFNICNCKRSIGHIVPKQKIEEKLKIDNIIRSDSTKEEK